ncbi:MAG TPA: hypothetical protein VKA21_01825 [Candidatus Binatia bacterium]|nr:hypothetical protein [Candidatus Binatia bacterium]
MPNLTVPTILLSLLLALAPRATRAASAEPAEGEWTSASLLRGPTAIANAPLLPFRSAVGGARLALDDPLHETKRTVILVPLLTAGGGVMGFVEAGIWLVTGLADTLTGGWFAIAPDDATELSVAPRTPLFAPESARPH